MIVGTIGLIEAAAARFAFLMEVGPGVHPGLFPTPPQAIPVVVGLILQLLIVAGMIHDKRTRGSIHPAWIAGIVIDRDHPAESPAFGHSGVAQLCRLDDQNRELEGHQTRAAAARIHFVLVPRRLAWLKVPL